ncbi:MAG: ABC transporter ATP-binding protein, partial [Alphaproteobacteria bacterium]|nr:ABC transporter ATP-binding protein [Alphaproteobacteria bacterium]
MTTPLTTPLTTPMITPMIVLEKIGLRYGDGPHILRDIDLTLAAG